MPSIVFLDPKHLDDMEYKIGCRAWVSFIRHRVLRQNKNALSLVIGQTGSGKSWSCLSLAELLMGDKPFPIENVCFSVRDLIRHVRSGNLRKGDVLIFEESGVGAFKQDWYSKNNKALGALLQTFRSMGIIVFFNCPSSMFMDTNAKRLIHYMWETQRINRQTNECVFKAQLMQPNERSGKVYYKNLRLGFQNVSSKIKEIKAVAVPKPSKAIIEVYELKKKQFQSALYEKLDKELAEAEAKEQVLPKLPYFCRKCGYIIKTNKGLPRQCNNCRSSKIENYTGKNKRIDEEKEVKK